MLRDAAVGLVIVGVVATSGCGLPSGSYDWNPALQKTEGKLDGIVKDLPLGTMTLLQHHHPKDAKTEGVTISNASSLMPFIHEQDAPLVYAAAYFQGSIGVSGAAYAALLPTGKTPAMEKKSFYVGKTGSLMETGTMLTFRVRPVEGLLPADSPCTLFRIVGDAGMMGEGFGYVALVGSTKNLYLELVTEGTLTGVRRESYMDVLAEGPFEATNDWSQESLKTLVAAHELTGLGVCSLPK